jgi:hypothetical protein
MPTRAVKEKVIGGHRYEVTLLGAKQGRAMLVRLMRSLGPATAGFIEGTLHAKGDITVSLASGASDAIRELSQRITEADFAAISDELARFTVVHLDAEHAPKLDAIFEEHFVGRYDVMLQWFAFGLEANFSSFFAGTASDKSTLAERFKSLMSLLPQSPQASTGTSTASQPAPTTGQA